MGGGVDFQVARGAANTSLWGPAAAAQSVHTLSSERQKTTYLLFGSRKQCR